MNRRDRARHKKSNCWFPSDSAQWDSRRDDVMELKSIGQQEILARFFFAFRFPSSWCRCGAQMIGLKNQCSVFQYFFSSVPFSCVYFPCENLDVSSRQHENILEIYHRFKLDCDVDSRVLDPCKKINTSSEFGKKKSEFFLTQKNLSFFTFFSSLTRKKKSTKSRRRWSLHEEFYKFFFTTKNCFEFLFYLQWNNTAPEEWFRCCLQSYSMLWSQNICDWSSRSDLMFFRLRLSRESRESRERKQWENAP